MKHYNYISFLLLFMSFLLAADLTPCMAVSPQKAKTKVVAKRPVAKTVKKRPASKTVKKRPASSQSSAQTLIRKAQSGDAEAQFKLGCCYAQGKLNLPKDGDKMIMWWKKAADQNHAEACYYLMFGLKDEEELLFYARKGTSLNEPQCCLTLGHIYTQKEEYKHLAGAVYLKAVELGQTPSTYPFFELAWAYQNGEYGLPKDKSKALFWYKKKCDQTYSQYLDLGAAFLYNSVLSQQKYIKENFNYDYDPALHVDEYKRWLKERTLPSDGGSSPRRSVASSVSSGTMRYHYTKSGRGQSQNTGQWTDSSGPEECNVEFGDNGITINGIYYDYVRTTGKWKVYGGLTMSFGGTTTITYYYVDSNKNMKQVQTSSGPYSSDTFVYPMSRNGDPTPQGSGVASGQSYGSGNGYSNGNGKKSLEERRRDNLNRGAGANCSLCKGTGKCFNCNGTGTANYYGTKKVCKSCDGTGICSLCHGAKVASWNR